MSRRRGSLGEAEEAEQRAEARAEEDATLDAVVEHKLDQAQGDVLRVLVVIAQRLGRIEDVLRETYDVVDRRIPGDL